MNENIRREGQEDSSSCSNGPMENMSTSISEVERPPRRTDTSNPSPKQKCASGRRGWRRTSRIDSLAMKSPSSRSRQLSTDLRDSQEDVSVAKNEPDVPHEGGQEASEAKSKVSKYSDKHVLRVDARDFEPSHSGLRLQTNGEASGMPSDHGAAQGKGRGRRRGKDSMHRKLEGKVHEPLKVEAAPDASGASAQSKKRSRKKDIRQQASEEDGLGTTEEEKDEDTILPHCLLCADPMKIISFGSCNHRVACAKCCLRLRMCYNKLDCPLCKMELKEVVIAPFRTTLPDFSYYTSSGSSIVARSRPAQLGPGIVMVDRWQPGNKPLSTKLLHEMINQTTLSCRLCDPKGRKPFDKMKLLRQHLLEKHNKYICMTCLRERRVFPLDLPLYDAPKTLQEHHDKAHPKCEFCRISFYDGDALFSHMQNKHFQCQICDPQRGDRPWYIDAEALQAHLQNDHFACDHAECAGCLVAFRTSDELKRHYLQRHSGRMSRWDPSSSRQLVFDFRFQDGRQRPHDTEGLPPEARGVRGLRGSRGRPSSRSMENGGRNNPSRDFLLETEGGTNVIDDDVGLLREGMLSGEGGAVSRLSTSRGAAGQSSRRNFVDAVSSHDRQLFRDLREEESFPSLAAVAMASRGDEAEEDRKSKLPPLVKHTIRCPCGRRVSHPVIEEGRRVPDLPCDSMCELEKRRRSLASAFGIDDPDRHVSVFNRKAASWTGALLAAGKRNPSFVRSVEKELESFVANPSSKRRSLQAMPRIQRAIVHGMCEQYGIATISAGQEPHRYIELIKVPSSAPALPDRMLSHVAETTSDEEIAELLAAAEGWTLRIVNIAPACDLTYYLRRWEGRYSIEEEEGGISAVIIRFDREEDRNEALDVFGGGIRGLFLLDRKWKPRTSLSVGSKSGNTDRAYDIWGGAFGKKPLEGVDEKSEGDGGRTAPSWTVVASTGQEGAGERSPSAASDQTSLQDSVPKGWTVISRKSNR